MSNSSLRYKSQSIDYNSSTRKSHNSVVRTSGTNSAVSSSHKSSGSIDIYGIQPLQTTKKHKRYYSKKLRKTSCVDFGNVFGYGIDQNNKKNKNLRLT